MFDELFRANSEITLNFFFLGLKEFIRPGMTLEERCYVASVLAHFAQTPRGALVTPSPDNLSQVFERFVLAKEGSNDPDILAIAGAECLFLAGFFRDQMRGRHNVRWYDELGRNFFGQVSEGSTGKKRELFGRLSHNFPPWALVCCELSRDLRDNRFLLKFEP